MESDREETGLALRRIRAVETLDNWTDPTPLDLDTLRAELGEPTNEGPHLYVWRTDEAHIACYEGQTVVCDRFECDGEDTIGDYVKAVVRMLGALRMALQVIADEAKDETETWLRGELKRQGWTINDEQRSGGDAEE